MLMAGCVCVAIVYMHRDMASDQVMESSGFWEENDFVSATGSNNGADVALSLEQEAYRVAEEGW